MSLCMLSVSHSRCYCYCCCQFCFYLMLCCHCFCFICFIPNFILLLVILNGIMYCLFMLLVPSTCITSLCSIFSNFFHSFFFFLLQFFNVVLRSYLYTYVLRQQQAAEVFIHSCKDKQPAPMNSWCFQNGRETKTQCC